MRGIEKALQECPGKTVLDLGCAEGLISFEFAKAGAKHVHGIEVVRDHLDAAFQFRNTYEMINKVSFQLSDIGMLKPEKQYDIVLALGVAHKLTDPSIAVRYAAESCKDLCVIRTSAISKDGILRSKRYNGVCDLNQTMGQAGFKREHVAPGPRGETVYYFRKC